MKVFKSERFREIQFFLRARIRSITIKYRLTNTGAVVDNARFTSNTASIAVRKYGYINKTETVDVSGQVNAISKVTSLSTDTQVVATEAVASAITGISFSVTSGVMSVTVIENRTTQEINDYIRYKLSTDDAYANTAFNIISISNGRLGITGSITTSATVSGGGNAASGITCTGTATTTGSGAYNLPVADSTGVDVEITALNPQAFTLDATYPATVLYRNVGASTWTRISTATASSVKFKRPASTETEISVRVPGYDWRTFTVNSGASGLSQSASLSAIRALDGTALFGVAGVQAQMASIISYDSADRIVTMSNSGASEMEIGLQSMFLKLTQLTHSPSMVLQLSSQIALNAARSGLEIPSGNDTTFRLGDGSASIFLPFLVKHQATGVDARDRFFGSSEGSCIAFSTQVNQLSVAIPTASDNASAVRTALSTELARIDASISSRSTLSLSANQTGVLDSLNGMIAAGKYTAAALENAPASSGGGTGGSGLTAAQAAQLARIHNTAIAHNFTLAAPIAQGATSIPLTGFADGYFTGHYIVINDGAGNVVQRYISAHTANQLTLNAPVSAVTTGQVVNILVRTTTQDGADVSGITTAVTAIKAKTDNLPASPAAVGSAMALTTAERTAVADAVQAAIIDEDDGKKVVDAIVKAVSTSGLTESAIAAVVRTDIERAGGKLDKAMKAAQAAEDQTVSAAEAEHVAPASHRLSQ